MSQVKRLHLLMLFGIGISSLGDFIYLVAINVLVLQLTGSPAAVAGLWIMSPIASILTMFWSGSLIDRMNNRNLMILMDVFRGLLVAVIPFLPSVLAIYVCLFFLSVAKAFFGPTSMTYITKLVPQEERKQFNSFRSLFTSGAFLIGPAIAGGLLLISSVYVAIWVNAISFIISAIILLFLPNHHDSGTSQKAPFTLKMLQEDWKYVLHFSRNKKYIVLIYGLAQFIMIIALGMDAQEVVFTQNVLGLSESAYGLLISLTGLGYVAGATAVSIFSKRLSIPALMGLGYTMVALGYMVYAFSFSFWSVAFGFMLLGFFNAFSSTGFMTFYQNNVPVDMMGRISSVFGTFQSMLQIIFILLIGFTGELLPLRTSIIIGAFLNLTISMLLILMVFRPSKQIYFSEEANVKGA